MPTTLSSTQSSLLATRLHLLHSQRSKTFGRSWSGYLARKASLSQTSREGILRLMAHSRSTNNNMNGATSHLSLVPAKFTKRIYFIRHGEGFHNIGYEGNLDAHLTPYGWHQAEALGQHIRNQQPTLGIELVVVSPLMRTLETAAGVFGGVPSAGSAQSDAQPLMLRKTGLPRERSAHDAIPLPDHPPFLANESCRERMSPNLCDQRRPLKLSKEAFPGVDFSLVEDHGGEDGMWQEVYDLHQSSGDYDIGESEDACTIRGIQFLKWLMQRPESCIAVVSHAGFIRHTLSAFAQVLPEAAQEELDREFLNCEMRCMVLSDTGIAPPKDKAFFPGGHRWRDGVASAASS